MQYLFCLHNSFMNYFDRIFAGNEMGGERYRMLFEQLGVLRFEREKGIAGITRSASSLSSELIRTGRS